MKEDIAKQWVAALRSGKYEQGKGMLRTADNKFCCLGVLCDILAADNWIPGATSEGGYKCFKHQAYTDVPSRFVRSIAGLHSDIGRLPSGAALTALNDSGFSFENIATIIEKEWEAL